MILRIQIIICSFLLFFTYCRDIFYSTKELSDIINKSYGPQNYLFFDVNGNLTTSQKEIIEADLYSIFQDTGYFTFCIIIPYFDTNSGSIYDYTYELMTLLEHPTGFDLTRSIVYLIAIEARKHTIRMGSQANARISNSLASEILSHGASYFSDDDYPQGMMTVMKDIKSYFQSPDPSLESSLPIVWMIIGCVIWLGLSIIPIIVYT